jgi:prepilin-type N-terminal cleavage/methylation domain-containing protein
LCLEHRLPIEADEEREKRDVDMLAILKKNEHGMTMIELLVTVALLALTTIAITKPINNDYRIWKTGDRYAEVMQNALIGIDKMMRELKYAQRIIEFSNPDDPEGYISFTDRLGVNRRFQYTNGYLLYDNIDAINDPISRLSGPISSLRFTCYQSDGLVPVPPEEPNKVAVIQIDVITYDSEGRVPEMPLGANVRTRMDKGDDVLDITDYCIYGRNGVQIKNNASITSSDFYNAPANIGALTNFIVENNNVQVQGNIVTGGSLTLINNSLVAHDVYVNNTVDMRNGATVSGNINCNGTVLWNNNISGYINIAPDGIMSPSGYTGPLVYGGVNPLKFYNPLPNPTSFSVGSGSIDTGGGLSLSPGTYGDVTMSKSGNLNLTTGRYFFKSIYASNGGTININVTSGPVQIFIQGDLKKNNDGNEAIYSVTGGSDKYKKVYTEVHGNLYWSVPMGTMYVHGNVTITNASKDVGIIGAIFSGGSLNLEHPNTPLSFIKAYPSILPWITPIN